MLSSLQPLLNKDTNTIGAVGALGSQNQLSVLENISKHLSVLHHRNAQLRNAILSSSEEKVSKRRSQFLAVLHSYVRLVIVELHGPIVESGIVGDRQKYLTIRKETFSGYENFIRLCNRSSTEMIRSGSDFTRELFQWELRLKEYQRIEKQFIYPLIHHSDCHV